MNRSLHARALGVAALLIVALAGCDGEDDPTDASADPSIDPPSSTATTATDEPTSTGPVEPTQPPNTGGATESGATAFVRHYYDVVNYATATGDVEELDALSEPSCTGCSTGIERIREIYARGGRIEGGAYRVVSVDPDHLRGQFWTATAKTIVGDQSVKGAGDLNQDFPGGPGGLHFELRVRNGEWSATSLEGL